MLCKMRDWPRFPPAAFLAALLVQLLDHALVECLEIALQLRACALGALAYNCGRNIEDAAPLQHAATNGRRMRGVCRPREGPQRAVLPILQRDVELVAVHLAQPRVPSQALVERLGGGPGLA